MLKAITWEQFSIFILVATGAYYMYVFLRYYRAEYFGWITRKKREDRSFYRTGKNSANNKLNGEKDPQASANQTELFERGMPQSSDERFDLMQRAITVIRQVITQGIENRLDRENLLDHIREVLGDYRRLRNTEYAETINNFLIRVCSSELSLEIGEGDLMELWK